VLGQIEDIGRSVLSTAIVFAPKRTLHYVHSLYLEVYRGANPRVVVGARDFKAWWIEFGAYGRYPPFRARAPLRRALLANGLRFVNPKV